MELKESQRKALAFVERHALATQAEAGAKLQGSLRATSLSEADYKRAMDQLRSQGRVALAFHPERVSSRGKSVAEGLLSEGLYRNQYETGLSGGSTSAFAGGRRDQWERRLFGGAYQEAGRNWAERPKYGALFLVGHSDGPCPRFGSCYFVLSPEVSARSSFTLLGSQRDDAETQTATLAAFDPVMAALARHLQSDPRALGCEGLTLDRLLHGMHAGVPVDPPGDTPDQVGRALDSFVEAQVHGTVDLERDVETLVVDASFCGTATGELLSALCSKYGIALRWHPGFTLPPQDFPVEFRGFEVRAFAERVAVGGFVDAPSLGAAQNDFIRDPDDWPGFGPRSQVLTSFRRVWHVLVLMGIPARQWSALRTRER